MAKTRSLSCVGLTSMLVLACGPNDTLVDESYTGESLGQVHGTLSSAGDVQTPEQISLAIVWFEFPPRGVRSPDAANPIWPIRPMCPGLEEVEPSTMRFPTRGLQLVVQPVSYEAQFPIRFQIPITTLPPQNVMREFSDGQGVTARVAQGILIAYADDNGNGTFDLGSPGNVPDRILTTSDLHPTLTEILFLEGNLDGRGRPGWVNAPQGFSLIRGTPGTGIEENLPISTAIELTLSAESEVIARGLACQEMELQIQSGNPPADAAIDCSVDGRSYSWSAEVTQSQNGVVAGTCVTRAGGACLESGAPVPADWPCQVE